MVLTNKNIIVILNMKGYFTIKYFFIIIIIIT